MKQVNRHRISNGNFQQETQPIVSVVMPVYNEEKYVEEAILSILNQKFSDFEFIIIDDGSSDHTPDIIRSFSDSRIRLLFNEKNKGNYPARNRACLQARGKYIAVMDADDIAMPERLERQVRYLEKNSGLLAVGSEYQFKPHRNKHNLPLKYEDICFSLLKDFSLLHPSLMIRSIVLKKLGGYNEEYIYASDYDLFCRLVLDGNIEILPDILMAYRIHENQISNQKKKIKVDLHIKFAKNIK